MSTAAEMVMTEKEVAEYLRVNPLPVFKVGATWRFKRADIDGWIAAQSTANIGG